VSFCRPRFVVLDSFSSDKRSVRSSLSDKWALGLDTGAAKPSDKQIWELVGSKLSSQLDLVDVATSG